jgi:hypothetical protein
VKIIVNVMEYDLWLLGYGEEVINIYKEVLVLFFAICMSTKPEPYIWISQARVKLELFMEIQGKVIAVCGP